MVREQLQSASFRNIPFLVADESASRGKKFVNHEYPNSNRRFLEELGKLPPIITINALVHGETALQQRFQLEDALEKEGLGELVHPIYGVLQVQSGGFTVNSNQRAMGEFRFSLTFYTTQQNVTITPSAPTKQTVSINATVARAAVDDAFENIYIDPESSINIVDAGEKLDSIFSDLGSSILSTKDLLEEESAEFTREIQSQKNSVYSVAQVGSDVKNSLRGAYESALFVVNSPDLLLEVWESLTDFNISPNGLTSLIGPVTTVSRKGREQNSNILDEHTRITGLINSFESLSYKSYQTESEIDAARGFLDDRYEKYVEDAIATAIDSGVTPIVLDQDLRRTLSDLRNSTKQALDEAEQNVWRVVNIKPGISSMSLTAYRYYGNLGQLDAVKDLNDDVNHANFSTTIKAVSK